VNGKSGLAGAGIEFQLSSHKEKKDRPHPYLFSKLIIEKVLESNSRARQSACYSNR